MAQTQQRIQNPDHPRRRTRSHSNRTAKRKRTRRKSRHFSLPKIPSGILIVCAIFAIMLALLFLQAYIMRLNEEVRGLEEDLTQVEAEIDSKNGQLLASRDIKAIETQARALGMTEAQPQQYIYESSAKKRTDIISTPAGLYDYINFFGQVRDGVLWTQE